LMEAVQNGYTEGIALASAGFVSEGSGENIFLVRDGQLYTPPLAASVLPGITRDTVIQLAAELGLAVAEQNIPREWLYLADELFFSGTAAEISPIRSVDRIRIGTGERGPITKQLQSAFTAVFEGGGGGHPEWLTFV